MVQTPAPGNTGNVLSIGRDGNFPVTGGIWHMLGEPYVMESSAKHAPTFET